MTVLESAPISTPVETAFREYAGPTELADDVKPEVPAARPPPPPPYQALRTSTVDGPPRGAHEARPTEAGIDARIPTPSAVVIAPTLGFGLGTPYLGWADLSLFIGASLPVRARAGNFVALGTQGVYTPLSAYRQYLTMHGVAGGDRGLLYSLGVGPVCHYPDSRSSVLGAEVEGRLGLVFTQRAGARIRGMFGLLARGGKVVVRFDDERHERPLFQMGAFIGFTRGPVGLRVRKGTARDPRPPKGLGLLIPGVLLLAAVGGTIIADIIIFSNLEPETCHGCFPLSVLAVPALGPGVPLTAVGAMRRHVYRKWRERMSFTPRATGFRMRF